MSHLENLLKVTPLFGKKILDIGSGRGGFLRDCKQKGIEAYGVECTKEYVEMTKDLSVIEARGEDVPLPSETFDFINCAQVLEHVGNPTEVVSEIHRLLKSGGQAFVTVPTRYSFKDPHFKLYFVNWLPRAWANAFITLFGAHKDYSIENGLQRLATSSSPVNPNPMHYYTYQGVQKLLAEFDVEDLRIRKVGYLKPLYLLLRNFTLDTFHLLITKPRATTTHL